MTQDTAVRATATRKQVCRNERGVRSPLGSSAALGDTAEAEGEQHFLGSQGRDDNNWNSEPTQGGGCLSEANMRDSDATIPASHSLCFFNIMSSSQSKTAKNLLQTKAPKETRQCA